MWTVNISLWLFQLTVADFNVDTPGGTTNFSRHSTTVHALWRMLWVTTATALLIRLPNAKDNCFWTGIRNKGSHNHMIPALLSHATELFQLGYVKNLVYQVTNNDLQQSKARKRKAAAPGNLQHASKHVDRRRISSGSLWCKLGKPTLKSATLGCSRK